MKMPTNFFDVIADIKVNIDESVDNSFTTVFFIGKYKIGIVIG